MNKLHALKAKILGKSYLFSSDLSEFSSENGIIISDEQCLKLNTLCTYFNQKSNDLGLHQVMQVLVFTNGRASHLIDAFYAKLYEEDKYFRLHTLDLRNNEHS